MTDERKPETPGLAEMSPKFIAEAEAAVETETSTDEALAALWEEWQRLWEANKKAVEEAQDDKLAGEIFSTLMTVEKRMEGMPARTVAGALLKLQVVRVWVYNERDETFEGEMGMMWRLTLSALADFERLARQRIVTMPEVEDPVLALKRKWETRWERYKSMPDDSPDEAMAPHHAALTEAEFAIYRTPATTPEGMAIKLRMWGRNHPDPDRGENWCEPPIEDIEGNLDDMPILSVLRDLERLSQETAAVASQTAAKTEPSGNDDATSKIMEHVKAAAKQGNERAQVMLDEDSDWREMIFVTIQDDKAVIQWPPVEITGQDDVLTSAFEETIGTQCAMDVIGHVRSHSKNYDGGRLMEVVEEIVKRSEWGHSEIGFFTGLGDFVTWGHIRTGIDFIAVPDDAGLAAKDTAGGSTA